MGYLLNRWVFGCLGLKPRLEYIDFAPQTAPCSPVVSLGSRSATHPGDSNERSTERPIPPLQHVSV